jgi:hypothetical protein
MMNGKRNYDQTPTDEWERLNHTSTDEWEKLDV